MPDESPPRERPYDAPEEDWEQGLLEGSVVVRVENTTLEAACSLADAKTSSLGDGIRLNGHVETGGDFEGSSTEVELISIPSVAFYDLDPPFLGIGLLHFLSGAEMREAYKPRLSDQLPLEGLLDRIERMDRAEDVLSARIFCETAAFEAHRRIVVDSASMRDTELRVSMSIVGLSRNWTRRSPLVITRFGTRSTHDPGRAVQQAAAADEPQRVPIGLW